MPEADGSDSKQFHEDVAQQSELFFLKGSAAYDWGMQHRLAQIFRPESGRTVMLAIDHGYFQGPTTGLERVDLQHPTARPVRRCAHAHPRHPALGDPADAWRRGSWSGRAADRSSSRSSPTSTWRWTSTTPCAWAPRAVAVQVFVGGEFETQSVRNMTRLVDAGYARGIPVLGVTAVGKELVRDARYLGLATRICAELGAQVVKTYYCDEGFERVTAGCPVPIVMAGGKKLPELDALTMAYRAIQGGAAGVDMGRNIFQSDAPVAMLQAVRKVVHEGYTPEQALEVYETVRREYSSRAVGAQAAG